MSRRMFILNEPNAPRLSPKLAEEIGPNESIILLQLEFWISISNNFIDGKYWTYQSLNDIKECFPFWSKATINRAIKNMINKNYIFEGNYNQKKYDKTRWFSLNYEELSKLKSIKIEGHETRSAQNETRSAQNGTRGTQNETRLAQNETTIPEITTDITTEITTDNIEPPVPYKKILELFNTMCKSLPKIKAITEKRKVHVKARWEQLAFDITAFEEAFNKLEDSDFCTGNNDRRWIANFDWLMSNDTNIIKVLEGKYDNRKPKGGVSNGKHSKDTTKAGPSEESLRLERLAKEKGLIREDGEIDDPECNF